MKLNRFTIAALIAAILAFVFFYNQDPESGKSAFTSYPKTNVVDKNIQNLHFPAKDKTELFYRFLPNQESENLIVLLHGSSYHGAYLITLAEQLHSHGDVCIPDIRGHGQSSKPAGSCNYVGQLEDDLADLIKQLPKSYKKVTLIGHSSGGGFAIRFANSKHKDLADSLILLSPAIVTAPTMDTPGARAWAHPKMIKFGELFALNAIGITRFNKGIVLTFNKPAEFCDGTETLSYDYNLAISMHPRVPYKKDLEAAGKKGIVLVGEKDEINNPQTFKQLFPVERVTIIPNCAHLDIVENKDAIELMKKHL